MGSLKRKLFNYDLMSYLKFVFLIWQCVLLWENIFLFIVI